jgi:hypothetical protein
MATTTESLDRRDFMKGAVGVGAALGLAGQSTQAGQSMTGAGRAIGANDRINLAIIGVGGRGTSVGRTFARIGRERSPCQIVAVADPYRKPARTPVVRA